MNEAQFKQAINRHIKRLCPEVYIWCIADKYTSGIPDCYYSHHKDIWIELKYGKKSYGLTDRQKDWVLRRAEQGRITAVIHGYDDHIDILTPVEKTTGTELILLTTTETKKQAAQWIISQISTPLKSGTTPQDQTQNSSAPS